MNTTLMASENPALSSPLSLRKCWTPSSSRSSLNVMWPPLKSSLDKNQESDDEGCSFFVPLPITVNTDQAVQSSILSKNNIDFNEMNASLNSPCSSVAAVPAIFTPNKPLSSRPKLERPKMTPQRRYSTSIIGRSPTTLSLSSATPDQPRMVKLKKDWIALSLPKDVSKAHVKNSCNATNSSLNNDNNGFPSPRPRRVQLKALWPPVPKPAASNTSPSDEISKLKVDVQSRRSSFDPKPKNKKDSDPSGTVVDSLRQQQQAFSSEGGLNLLLVHMKDRRLEFERKSITSGTDAPVKTTVVEQVMDSHDLKSRTMEEVMQEATLTSALLEQQQDCEHGTHHHFVMPSGQKLPKGSAQMHGKKGRRRTNYRIRYTGPTSLRLEDVYGNLMSVPELDDRFDHVNSTNDVPCQPRRRPQSPYAPAGRKRLDTMPSRPVHRCYDSAEGNDDMAPRMPSRSFDDDNDNDWSDYSDHEEYEDEEHYEGCSLNDPHRIRAVCSPDVWISPIPGPKDRKWKVKRVWNVGQVDDQEIEHDVKNQDLLDFIRTLLGVTPKAVGSENESSDNVAPCWHIQKCYDVDGEVETSEAEATITEDVMIQEMHVISKDCKDEFEAVDEDDENEYYYEEKVEETPRRQTSIHMELAYFDSYFDSGEWMSPTEKLNQAARKWKVKREWSTESSDTDEKNDLLPADDTRLPEAVNISDRSDEPSGPKEIPLSKYDWVSPVTGARRNATKVIRTADRKSLKLWGQGF